MVYLSQILIEKFKKVFISLVIVNRILELIEYFNMCKWGVKYVDIKIVVKYGEKMNL